MNVVKIILQIIFLIDCIALTVVVLMQEGKQQGLGTIAGAAETYWGKNRGRSMEGGLVKATTVMGILFFVISMVLNMLSMPHLLSHYRISVSILTFFFRYGNVFWQGKRPH